VRQDLAFLFPGQGSQSIGMLARTAEAFPEVSAVFAEASDALGYDLWDLIQNGDEDTLRLTEFTQPALLAGSVAIWRAWLANGGQRPGAMSGHSLGEFSALCCAGALSLAEAVTLVQARGRFMQNAVPAGLGAMAAVIGLDDDTVNAICAEATVRDGAIVEAVNYNCPGQVVIAGHAGAVKSAGERMLAAGARRVLPLPVSAPFHTSLMAPAGDLLNAALDRVTISTPEIPVVHNVGARTESDPAKIRKLLVRQISAPVPWTDCIKALCSGGATRFAECGAGRVLGGLLRRIDKTLSCAYLENPEALIEARDALAT
jgi:[acyl-carrier-protein] S-malonyltransferase